MSNVLLLEAKCARCHQVFGYPTLSDFAYGEMVFCTIDGKHHVLASAFDEFAQRVSDLLEAGEKQNYWGVLASLADPVGGQPLSTQKRCPHCCSSHFQYWGGRDVGMASVPSASFESASRLTRADLAHRVVQAEQYVHVA